MSRTRRYFIGHRYGPRMPPASEQQLDSFVSQQKDAATVRTTRVGRRVVQMTEDQMRALANGSPELVIEEDEPLELFTMPGLPPRLPGFEGFSIAVTVKDQTTGKPVPDVTVYGIGAGIAYQAVTDAKGQANLQTHEPQLVRVIASPRDTYWSRVVPDVDLEASKSLAIDLKPLLVTGAYDWGHRVMGFRQANAQWTGNEVRVGVIDSGITDEHKDLNPSGGHNTLDGQDPKAWDADEKGHGTHVGGIIAALNNDIGVVGGAPNAKVFSLKVFPGGFVSDLVEAVEWCIQNQIDVISMSLGGRNPSRLLAGVLRDAYDRGITCIAATGNEASRVAYPAAIPTVIAVGALGAFGSFPEDSAHSLKVSGLLDSQGRLFAGNFSNFGPEVDVCAPGVAVLSTVPSGFAAWDGTSMACPMVSALAALILEAYPQIRTGDSQQAEYVKWILTNSAVDLGLPPFVQGRGLPLATRALPPAPPATPSASWCPPGYQGATG